MSQINRSSSQEYSRVTTDNGLDRSSSAITKTPFNTVSEANSITPAATTEPRPLFSIFGKRSSGTNNDWDRFPTMKVLASCIRSITAGLSSAGSILGKISWSAYTFVVDSAKDLIGTLCSSNDQQPFLNDKTNSKLTDDANKLFKKGSVEIVSVEEASRRYEESDKKAAGPNHTKTILTEQMKSTAEMEMMVDDIHQERLMPLACAQFYGAEDRKKLLDQALYLPGTQKEHLVTLGQKLQGEINNYANLKNSITEKKQALIEKQAALQGYEQWPSYRLAAVAKTDSLVSSRKVNLLGIQETLLQAQGKLADLQQKLQVAQTASSKEEIGSDTNFEQIPQLQQQIGKLKKKEQDLQADIKSIQATLEKLTEEAQKANWDQLSCQAILKFVNKTDPEKFEFGRIQVKVNGEILPLRGSSPQENFPIFQEALQKLASSKKPSLTISDAQIKDMFTLCSCEKTVAGTPAGSASAGDELPSFGAGLPLFEGNIDSYEIVIPEDNPSSIDFQFHSGRALLPKIQFQGGNSKEEQLILLRHRDGGTPDHFQQFERSCSFTYRYTPKTSEGEPLNMEHGNLELIKSQQAFFPISLVSSTIQKSFENELNNPDKEHLQFAFKDQLLGDSADAPIISFQFYRDCLSKNCPFFLKDEKGKTTPLFSPIPDNSEESENQSLDASTHFIDFIGDKDQALAVSRITNQAWLGVLFSSMNTENGPFRLDDQVGIPAVGMPTFTFSKSQNGKITAHASFKGHTKAFSFSNTEKSPIRLDSQKSYANIDYDMTFDFDTKDSTKPPRISIGPITYDYYFEKHSEQE